MMATKTHPKWKTTIDRKTKERMREKIPMKECPACLGKCGHCRWPFTLSTAQGKVEEIIFCSEYCARQGLAFDDESQPTYYKRARHYD